MPSKKPDRLPAEPGMKWRQLYTDDGESVIEPERSPTYEVVPSCGRTDERGWWVCIEHSMAFQNNWAKDSHITEKSSRKKPCHLAWFCAFCGKPEVP